MRLKEKAAEFLRSYTPLVFDAIKEYVVRQQQMLQECSAAFAGLTGNTLGGMRIVRAKRVDIEVCMCRRLQCHAAFLTNKPQEEDIKAKMSQKEKVYLEREE